MRKASSGSKDCKNAHPFVYQNWIFAHNGTINDKNRISQSLKSPYNQSYISEKIDSEIYFRFIIQCINEHNDIIEGIKDATREVIKDCSGANFLLSDGESLYAFRYGRSLFFLERDPALLSEYSEETKALIESKSLSKEKAILIASEKITKGEKWEEIKDNDLLICKQNIQLDKIPL